MKKSRWSYRLNCPTACVTCVWAGVDSAWEQEKLEARKMLENAAESHTSGAPSLVHHNPYGRNGSIVYNDHGQARSHNRNTHWYARIRAGPWFSVTSESHTGGRRHVYHTDAEPR